MADKQILQKTLGDLSSDELSVFKRLILSETDCPPILRQQLKSATTRNVVEGMMATWSEKQGVEMAKMVLEKMNRADLVGKLSDPSPDFTGAGPSAEASGVKTMTDDKHFIDKHKVELIMRVGNTVPIFDGLLNEGVIHHQRFDEIKTLPTSQEKMRYLLSFCLSTEASKDILYQILKDYEPYLIDDLETRERGNVTGRVGVKQILLDTLNDLSSEELDQFMTLIELEKDFPPFLMTRLSSANARDTMQTLLETDSQECMELTKRVLKTMHRTDLVQRLTDIRAGSKDEKQPSMIERVEAMASVIELLLETMADLSGTEFRALKEDLYETSFKWRPNISRRMFQSEDTEDTVFLMVLHFGLKSVRITEDILKKLNRNDLVQRLTDPSSGTKKKHSDECHRELIQKVGKMAAVKQLLSETLTDLSDQELQIFESVLEQIFKDKNLQPISSRDRQSSDNEFIVDKMLQRYGQRSVELTREAFNKMNRMDLAQKFSEPSSELQEKYPVFAYHESLLATKEAQMNTKRSLENSLRSLSEREFDKFKRLLQFTYFEKSLPQMYWLNYLEADHLVDWMVKTLGQQSVEVTKEVLTDMNRTDLVASLSWRLKEKHASKLTEVTIAPLQRKLLETINNLSQKELMEVKRLLQYTVIGKGLVTISGKRLKNAGRCGMVELMVENYGQESVKVMTEVLKKINRNDLVQMSDGSRESKGVKPKVPNPLKPQQKVSNVTSDTSQHNTAFLSLIQDSEEETLTVLEEKLLETLRDLTTGELERFKHVLQFTDVKKGFPRIPGDKLEPADRIKTVKLVVENYGQESVEVMMEVLKKINRNDLVQMLSDDTECKGGSSRSLEPEGGHTIVQDSSDWTKLDPAVKNTEADEAPTYSLQSDSGRFECSVSGLRWLCEEKVCFKYQFCSWEEHEERIEIMNYMPAGPLIDITVISGKLDEVYLPHWICTDGDPAILDKFAVLHIDDCGDNVESVSPTQVTPFHVKLSEMVFSPRAALMRLVSVKMRCNVLIYKANTSFLTLHVYLTPCDPGLQQIIDERQLSYGYEIIRKPHPEQSLRKRERFSLQADLRNVEICPPTLKLRHESRNLNFFEVYIENPETNFKLSLTHEKDRQPVWTCVIRKDEYQSIAQAQDRKSSEQVSQLESCGNLHFVDKHRVALIDRVSNINPILDRLLDAEIIDKGVYCKIRALPTSDDQMRALYSGCLKGGDACKDLFYQLLEQHEKFLMKELKKKSG